MESVSTVGSLPTADANKPSMECAYQIMYSGVGSPDGQLTLQSGLSFQVPDSAVVQERVTNRHCTWPLQEGCKYSVWDVGSLRLSTQLDRFDCRHPLPQGALLRTACLGDVDDYLIGGPVQSRTTTYKISQLEPHSRLRRQAQWRRFLSTVPQIYTKRQRARRLVDAGVLQRRSQEMVNFLPTRAGHALTRIPAVPNRPQTLRLPISLFLAQLRVLAVETFGGTTDNGGSEFDEYDRQQVVHCAALLSADEDHTDLLLDTDGGLSVGRSQVWAAFTSSHDEAAVEREFAARSTAAFRTMVADVPGADLTAYENVHKVAVPTYAMCAERVMNLLENLRPTPNVAGRANPSRDTEFAAAVRAGIPEVLCGGQARTDLSRRVVEIEDAQPRKLVRALLTESRQAYVDNSPPITTMQVLRGVLSCSEILAHTFLSDLDRSNDRIDHERREKGAKSKVCYMPVPPWATADFCSSKTGRFRRDVQACVDISGAIKYTLQTTATLVRVTAVDQAILDEFRTQYRDAMTVAETYTSELESEDAVSLVVSHRLLLSRCQLRLPAFITWVNKILAGEVSETESGHVAKQGPLQSVMTRYINAQHSHDKRVDVRQPRYHHRVVLQAFCDIEGASAVSTLCEEQRLVTSGDDMQPVLPPMQLLAPNANIRGDLSFTTPFLSATRGSMYQRPSTTAFPASFIGVQQQLVAEQRVTVAIGLRGPRAVILAGERDTVATLLGMVQPDFHESLYALHGGRVLHPSEQLRTFVGVGIIHVLCSRTPHIDPTSMSSYSPQGGAMGSVGYS
jgi:hypothetical protein